MNKKIIISCAAIGLAVIIVAALISTKTDKKTKKADTKNNVQTTESSDSTNIPVYTAQPDESNSDTNDTDVNTDIDTDVNNDANDVDNIDDGDTIPAPTDNAPTSDTTIDDSYSSSMYDYSKAGMKNAKGHVSPSDYISVADYGVSANSGTDVSDAVEKAIYSATSKGKYLYFPEGTYYIKNVKVYDVNNVRICGAGEKTILKTSNDATGDNWDITMGIFNANGVIVRNLVFDGNNQNVAGDTHVGVLQLRIDNCDNAKVYGCRFQNNNNGNVNIVNEAKNLEIFFCDFLNSDCSIITSPGYITGGHLCNNFIDGQNWNLSEPISLYYANDLGSNTDVVISGNDIRNHNFGAGAIFITYPSVNISILNNYIYKCGAGVGSGSQRQTEDSTVGPTDVTVKNNVIDSPTWQGLALLYADQWTIEKNTVKNVTDGYGIYLDDCNNNIIKNNSLNGSGIHEEECTGNTKSNNK